jgi:hypothetical protein
MTENMYHEIMGHKGHQPPEPKYWNGMEGLVTAEGKAVELDIVTDFAIAGRIEMTPGVTRVALWRSNGKVNLNLAHLDDITKSPRPIWVSGELTLLGNSNVRTDEPGRYDVGWVKYIPAD